MDRRRPRIKTDTQGFLRFTCWYVTPRTTLAKNPSAGEGHPGDHRRDFASSCLNTTKWRELAQALAGLGVTYKVKFVDSDQEFAMRSFRHVTGDWLDSGSTGPFTAISVEWLDINPVQEVRRGALVAPARINHQEEVERRLRSVRVPYQCESGFIRIVGHVRSSVPSWPSAKA